MAYLGSLALHLVTQNSEVNTQNFDQYLLVGWMFLETERDGEMTQTVVVVETGVKKGRVAEVDIETGVL